MTNKSVTANPVNASHPVSETVGRLPARGLGGRATAAAARPGFGEFPLRRQKDRLGAKVGFTCRSHVEMSLTSNGKT